MYNTVSHHLNATKNIVSVSTSRISKPKTDSVHWWGDIYADIFVIGQMMQ